LKSTLNLKNNPVVRGFIPDGQRSSPKTYHRITPDIPCFAGLRLLRSRSGMNPLTTGDCIAKGDCIATGDRIAAGIGEGMR
jgi:hypothetical protein